MRAIAMSEAAKCELFVGRRSEYFHKDEVVAMLDSRLGELGNSMMVDFRNHLGNLYSSFEARIAKMGDFVTASQLDVFGGNTLISNMSTTIRETVNAVDSNLERQIGLLSETNQDKSVYSCL